MITQNLIYVLCIAINNVLTRLDFQPENKKPNWNNET